MNLRDPYWGPTVVLFGADLILGGIGVSLLVTPGTPWAIRGIALWVLATAGWMGWHILRELAD